MIPEQWFSYLTNIFTFKNKLSINIMEEGTLWKLHLNELQRNIKSQKILPN